MIKIPVVNRIDYTMYLELHDSLLWFHTDVRKWTAKVKVKYLGDLHLLQYLTDSVLFAMVHENDKKLAKFATAIGFKFKQPLLGQDKKMYHIYSRSL